MSILFVNVENVKQIMKTTEHDNKSYFITYFKKEPLRNYLVIAFFIYFKFYVVFSNIQFMEN